MLAGICLLDGEDKTFNNFDLRDFVCSLRFWLVFLDFHRSLTVDTWGTTERCSNIANSAALNVVFVPGLLPEQQRGDAGHEAAQQAAQDARLAEVLPVSIHETWLAKGSTTTDGAVPAAVAQALFPLSHFLSKSASLSHKSLM